jgi:AraC-like DNA-binding protein
VALLAVYQPDLRTRARVQTALHGDHDLVYYEEWSTMRSALDQSAADGLLIDVYHPGRAIPLLELQRVRERFPSLAIVVYSDFASHGMDPFALGRMRIDGVLPATGTETANEIRGAIEQALATSVATKIVNSLHGRVPPLALDALQWAIENAHRNPPALDLATHFTRTPEGMTRALLRDAAPPPVRLLLWGRLFRGTHLLADRGLSIERAAMAVGYSSGAAFSRALRDATGYAAREVRARGGIPCVLEGFLTNEVRRVSPRTRGRWKDKTPSPRRRR